ncbi:hypothetical protein ACF1BQ_014050 [Bradyrhizobium sp. RDT10]
MQDRDGLTPFAVRVVWEQQLKLKAAASLAFEGGVLEKSRQHLRHERQIVAWSTAMDAILLGDPDKIARELAAASQLPLMARRFTLAGCNSVPGKPKNTPLSQRRLSQTGAHASSMPEEAGQEAHRGHGSLKEINLRPYRTLTLLRPDGPVRVEVVLLIVPGVA